MKFKTKLIIILIIVILLCVIGYFARKVIIFNNYRLAQEKFSKIDNFYIRTVEENTSLVPIGDGSEGGRKGSREAFF